MQAARDLTTAVNVWAPHGTDCKLLGLANHREGQRIPVRLRSRRRDNDRFGIHPHRVGRGRSESNPR